MVNIVKTAGAFINGLGLVAPSLAGKLMLDLFCRPKDGRVFSKKDSAFLQQAVWSEIYLDGKKVQCYSWGTGSKKMLLAHGFNSNAARWRPLTNLLLAADYQVIAIDVPAHGHSDWKKVNGLLYARVLEMVFQKFNPDFVVGHSFAGIAIAYYFSKMKPLSIEKLILMGVPNELDDVTQVFFRELRIKPTIQTAYYQTFKEKFGYDIDYFTLSNLLKTVPYPAMIIHDKNDNIASFKGAQMLHQAWTGSHFFATQNLGHSLQGRNVFQVILRFIAEE